MKNTLKKKTENKPQIKIEILYFQTRNCEYTHRKVVLGFLK